MATIQDVLQLDISRVAPKELQLEVQELIKDYQEIEAKEIFERNAADNINEIYTMVVQVSPDAISENPCKDPEEKASTPAKAKKKKKISSKKSTSPKEQKSKKSNTKKETKRTATKKDVDAVMEEIRHCRLKIKKFNEEKRKEEGPKPKPTRYAKIKAHIVSLGNLIPKPLKEDIEVQKATSKLLKSTHRSLLKIYQMNALKGQKDNEELQERFDKIEEKLETK